MMTGWIQLDGKYYYLNPANEGKMIAGTTATINGVQYNFDGSGVCPVSYTHLSVEILMTPRLA